MCDDYPMSGVAPGSRLDELLREFHSVQQELTELPEDEFTRRRQLNDRESELRTELREFSAERTDTVSIDQLRRLIAQTERRISEHYGHRLSHTSGAQTGRGGGLDPKILFQMHRAMDKFGNLPEMQAELARLKDRLAALEGK
jgi:hypothetical protein